MQSTLMEHNSYYLHTQQTRATAQFSDVFFRILHVSIGLPKVTSKTARDKVAINSLEHMCDHYGIVTRQLAHVFCFPLSLAGVVSSTQSAIFSSYK